MQLANNEGSTFFGIVLVPGFDYRTLLNDELLITRAVLSPDCLSGSATLIVSFGKKRVSICQLSSDCSSSCALNIAAQKGDEIVLSSVGDCSIHVSGFYAPAEYGVRRFVSYT